MGASAKSAVESPRPNILFCIADDATFYHFSAAGCGWTHTPNFDRLAEGGILMENCYTPNAKSAPSRACVLTGRNSWQLGAAGNHLNQFPADVKVFTEVLSENGYSVAFTGKGCAPCDPGEINGVKRQLTGVPYNKYSKDKPTTMISRVDYARNLDDYFAQKSDDKPFFFWFGSNEPHRKYEYMTGINVGGKSIDMIDEVPPFWPDTDSVRIDMLDYSLEIEEFDKQLGEVYDVLEKYGQEENTIIIITADNGMPFPRCKANNYEYATHMPFVVYWKGGLVNPGRRIEEYVSFIDIAPTVLDYAGIEWAESGMGSTPGTSLRAIIEDNVSKKEAKQRSFLLFGRERDDSGRPNNGSYPIRAILRDGIFYLWNCEPDRMPAGEGLTGYSDVDGSPTKSFILNQNRAGDSSFYDLSFALRPEEEMFSLADDPYCVNNLANDPDYQKIRQKLRAEMIAKLKEQRDPRMFGEGEIYDNYPFMRESSWNIYERVVDGSLAEPWNQTGWIQPTDYEQYEEFLKRNK